jgi:F-type H+-transporting ATPase subunit c
VALGLPIAALGGALGQGKAAAAALEGIARQPEAAGEIRTLLLLSLALIESLVIYAFVAFFILNASLGKLVEYALAGH